MLVVDGITKAFGHHLVLEDFNLTLPRNGFTVLVGPSGCGKTTLFDVMTGIAPRDSGDIQWLGRSVKALDAIAAYMQQKDLLLPWLSLMGNALLPARIAGAPANKAREHALTLFKRLGLAGYEDYLPKRVSGGMRQRCALVRTLMFDRELVLLDEPLSALDAITRRHLHGLLLLLQSEFNRTLLMITHDIEEALLLGDDVLILGGTPLNVIERLNLDWGKPRSSGDPRLVRSKEYALKLLAQGSDR